MVRRLRVDAPCPMNPTDPWSSGCELDLTTSFPATAVPLGKGRRVAVSTVRLVSNRDVRYAPVLDSRRVGSGARRARRRSSAERDRVRRLDERVVAVHYLRRVAVDRRGCARRLEVLVVPLVTHELFGRLQEVFARAVEARVHRYLAHLVLVRARVGVELVHGLLVLFEQRVVLREIEVLQALDVCGVDEHLGVGLRLLDEIVESLLRILLEL